MSRIAVLGAGSWGTALAIHLARSGRTVRLWARDPRLVERMARTKANQAYLPDAVLPPGVTPEAVLSRAVSGAAFLVAAVPSHGLRDVMRVAAPLLSHEAIVVSATKG